VFTPGVGFFAGGGAVALVLGGLFLFEEALEVSRALVIPLAGVVGGGTALAGRIAMRVRRTPSMTGAGALIGHSATVKRQTDGVAQVFVEGAWWRARSDRPLEIGTSVRIVGVEGLDLLVEAQEE
jgi:membrane-bound serine protease (ClpP class)